MEEQCMRTILAVDDSMTMRQLVAFSLRQHGYQVIEAVDGLDAMAKLQQHRVDLIITDLHMPRLDGIELIRQVRAQGTYRFLPIVMLTTETQESKKVEGRQAGATGWIVKPFEPEQLIKVVKRVLS
jgi:two-component system chemotaxis response regulator CheY